MVTSFHHCATSSWAANELFHSYNFTKFCKYFMREPNAVCSLRHSELDSLNTAVRQYNPRFFESVVIWGAGRHYRGDVGPPRSNHRSHPGTGEFKSSTDWPLIPRLTVVLILFNSAALKVLKETWNFTFDLCFSPCEIWMRTLEWFHKLPHP